MEEGMNNKNGSTRRCWGCQNHDGKNQCNCGGSCGGCGGSGRWGGGGHVLLRLILAAAIVAITFGVGMKVGEFKGEIGGGSFGRHMMGGWNNSYDNLNYPIMMRGYLPQQQTTTPAPAK